MLLQRLATGATGVKQDAGKGSEALVRACAVYTACLALANNAWCNACIQCLHMNSAEGFAL